MARIGKILYNGSVDRQSQTPDEIKPTDSRAKVFIERGLEPAAQLEAFPPDTLARLPALP